jgi:hypothetical protein
MCVTIRFQGRIAIRSSSLRRHFVSFRTFLQATQALGIPIPLVLAVLERATLTQQTPAVRGYSGCHPDPVHHIIVLQRARACLEFESVIRECRSSEFSRSIDLAIERRLLTCGGNHARARTAVYTCRLQVANMSTYIG